MKVHSVVRQYNNGASAIQKCFSSRKKAEAWVEMFYADPCSLDGYDVWCWDDCLYGKTWRLIPPNNDVSMSDVIYIVSKKVE